MDAPHNADATPMAARNPAEAQVDILLEAQRSIGKRLTSLEIAVGQMAETIALQDQGTQKAFRVLQAEMEALKQLVSREPAPRRCLHCFHVINTSASICPACQHSL